MIDKVPKKCVYRSSRPNYLNSVSNSESNENFFYSNYETPSYSQNNMNNISHPNNINPSSYNNMEQINLNLHTSTPTPPTYPNHSGYFFESGNFFTPNSLPHHHHHHHHHHHSYVAPEVNPYYQHLGYPIQFPPLLIFPSNTTSTSIETDNSMINYSNQNLLREKNNKNIRKFDIDLLANLGSDIILYVASFLTPRDWISFDNSIVSTESRQKYQSILKLSSRLFFSNTFFSLSWKSTDSSLIGLSNKFSSILHLDISESKSISTDTIASCFKILTSIQTLSLFTAPIEVIEPISLYFHSLNYLSIRRGQNFNDLSLELLSKSNYLKNTLEYFEIDTSSISDNGLKSLSTLSNLKILKLITCKNFADNGVFYLSSLKNLKELIIRNYENITDSGLYHLIKLRDHLEVLEISECSKSISDIGLSYISRLSNLISLNIFYCGNVTDLGLSRIMYLKNLQTLDLSFTRLTDDGLHLLSEYSSSTLSSLNISGCIRVTDVGLKYLSEYFKNKLLSLDVSFCENITDLGLEYISRIRSLEIVKVSSCQAVSDRGVQSLSHLPLLTGLDISGLDCVFDEGILSLARLVNLNWLDISLCPNIFDTGLHCIANLPQLTNLKTSCCSFNGEGFNRRLPPNSPNNNNNITYNLTPPKLSSLTLIDCTCLTDTGVFYLVKEFNESLTHLEISGCEQITDVSIDALSNLSNLQSLTLSDLEKVTYCDEKVSSLLPLCNVKVLK